MNLFTFYHFFLHLIILLWVSMTVNSSAWMKFIHPAKNILREFTDEIQYRWLNAIEYRERINNRIQITVEKFKKDRLDETSQALLEINNYVTKAQDLYKEVLFSIEQQRNELSELNRFMQGYDKLRETYNLDESLDQFRKFYNVTIENSLKSINPKYDSVLSLDKISKSIEDLLKLQKLDSMQKRETLLHKLSERKEVYDMLLQTNLMRSWDSILKTSEEASKSIESNTKPTISEFLRFQEDLINELKMIAMQAQNSLKREIIKSNVRNEKKSLEVALRKLEKELYVSPVWQIIEVQKKQAETLLKAIQEKIQFTNSSYDALMNKKKESMYYNYMNDVTLNKVLKLIDPSDKGWSLIRSEDGIQVFRKFMGLGPGSSFACMRCSAIINSSVENVFELFYDPTRICEYNSFHTESIDIDKISDSTKVVYSSSPPIFPFKPRDFCTVIHFRRLKDGTVVVLNRNTVHPKAPEKNEFVRANIILGANIIQPHKLNQVKLTMLIQVDPGGFPPPMIVNHISSLGPIGFMKNIEQASKRSKGLKPPI